MPGINDWTLTKGAKPNRASRPTVVAICGVHIEVLTKAVKKSAAGVRKVRMKICQGGTAARDWSTTLASCKGMWHSKTAVTK